MKNKRFVVVEATGNGLCSTSQIIVDTKTGVNYLFVKDGYAGGLTVLLDSEGKPVVTPVTQIQ